MVGRPIYCWPSIRLKVTLWLVWCSNSGCCYFCGDFDFFFFFFRIVRFGTLLTGSFGSSYSSFSLCYRCLFEVLGVGSWRIDCILLALGDRYFGDIIVGERILAGVLATVLYEIIFWILSFSMSSSSSSMSSRLRLCFRDLFVWDLLFVRFIIWE